MKAHIFQHVPFEGPGSIGSWLKSQNAHITTTRFYRGEFPPDIDEIDLLIVMGGPMSVNDTDNYPWLELEKIFISAAINAGKAVLGICLGAQLIASATGAKVYKNPTTEIGWFPITGTNHITTFRFPETLTVFHWHGETFDFPTDATLLASSPDCQNQAFQLNGKKVVGLQFHLETTPESLQSIIQHCQDEIIDGPKIMSETEMKNQAPDHLQVINQQMADLLTFLTTS
ncbi:type 1 glutamine amidotransferase [Kiritimatiellaeota bacterium B1221]|nr:type 1 glutamine amidotransferase [Kiritimatiellaeota bacterium B1221]